MFFFTSKYKRKQNKNKEIRRYLVKTVSQEIHKERLGLVQNSIHENVLASRTPIPRERLKLQVSKGVVTEI